MSSLSRGPRILVAILVVLASVVVMILSREPESRRGIDERALDTGADSALSSTPASDRARNAGAGSERIDHGRGFLTPGDGPSDPSSADQSRLSPFDYGVRGKVRLAGSEPLYVGWASEGVIRAVDVDGIVHSDRIESNGEFQLYELGPGLWFVDVDLGVGGKATTTVQLTLQQPEVEIELVTTPGVRVDVQVSLQSDPSVEEADSHDRSPLLVVAHRRAAEGPQTSFSSLDPISYFQTRVGAPREDNSRVSAGWLSLPADEELMLSLFVDDLWIASRTRSPGEKKIDWDLTEDLWLPAWSSLEITLLDARTQTPLEYGIRPLNWRADRKDFTESKSTLFDSIPPGWRLFETGGGDHELLQHSIFIPPGKDIKETIELERGAKLYGKVVDPDGEPAAVHLAAWGWDSEKQVVEPRVARTCTSNSDGEFKFNDLRPGNYVVRSVQPREVGREADTSKRPLGSHFLEVDAHTDREEVRIQLHPLSTLVIAAGASLQETITWRVEDGAGRWIADGVIESAAPQRAILPVGSYTLIAEGPGFERVSLPLKLAKDEERVDL